MNTRSSEIRTYHDMQKQIELERMLAARRAAEAAREERFRKLPTPHNERHDADKVNVARWEVFLAAAAWAGLMYLSSWLAGWV